MSRSLVVVDSAIWIDHINKGDAELASLLRSKRVRLHPMIVGEVALGSVAKRDVVLRELQELPALGMVSHAEVMAMIEWLKLWSTGIGYVDAHLLASTRQAAGCELWTPDKKLHVQAERLGVAYSP